VTEDNVTLVALLDLDSVGGVTEKVGEGAVVQPQQKGFREGRKPCTAHVEVPAGPNKWGDCTDLVNVELATFYDRKVITRKGESVCRFPPPRVTSLTLVRC
jgi:hypothetical protein